jgi:inner membrane protease subunit SOM1
MAPPTPILTKEDINKVFEWDKRVDPSTCVLKSITQFNCSFDGGLVTCVPFKRLFNECVVKGKKRRIAVEITDVNTNTSESEVMKFLREAREVREMQS